MANCAPLVQKTDETNDQFQRRLMLSAKGYKTHLTLKVGALSNLTNFFEASPSAYGVQELKKSIDVVSDIVTPIAQRLQ